MNICIPLLLEFWKFFLEKNFFLEKKFFFSHHGK